MLGDVDAKDGVAEAVRLPGQRRLHRRQPLRFVSLPQVQPRKRAVRIPVWRDGQCCLPHALRVIGLALLRILPRQRR